MILGYRGSLPKIHPSVFVAETAQIIGRVEVGADSSVWYNAVVRGDSNTIKIGRATNLQDNCVLHVDPQYPLEVGDYVTVGHLCIVHGSKIGSRCLIGMGSIILSGAEIGEGCLVGAGSLVLSGTKFPSGYLVLGSPAKPVRGLKEQDMEMLKRYNDAYLGLREEYLKERGEPSHRGSNTGEPPWGGRPPRR